MCFPIKGALFIGNIKSINPITIIGLQRHIGHNVVMAILGGILFSALGTFSMHLFLFCSNKFKSYVSLCGTLRIKKAEVLVLEL